MSVQPYYEQPGLAPVPVNGWAPVPAPQPQVARPPTQLEKLGEWAQAAQAAYSVAEKLVGTSFVPAQFKGKAHEATAAILAGSEVGLSPMAALRSFDIIQGVAAPRALTLRAVVQAAGHDIWVAEATETRAIVRGRRKGSDKVQESVWTVDRARGLGLLGKDNWKKQQGAMLVARASSECCRLIASDAILGLPYAAEELYDEDAAPLRAEQVTSAPAGAQPAARTTRRRTPPANKPVANTRPPTADQPPMDGPPLPEDEAGDDEQLPLLEPDDDGDGVTKAQLTKLAVTLKEAGVTDRDRGLKLESILTGRDIGSSKDLTKLEASNIIDHLERLNGDDVNAIIDGDGDQQ
jgi:hypothetical protein